MHACAVGHGGLGAAVRVVAGSTRQAWWCCRSLAQTSAGRQRQAQAHCACGAACVTPVCRARMNAQACAHFEQVLQCTRASGVHARAQLRVRARCIAGLAHPQARCVCACVQSVSARVGRHRLPSAVCVQACVRVVAKRPAGQRCRLLQASTTLPASASGAAACCAMQPLLFIFQGAP